MKRQKIFYYHEKTKVLVKPESITKTKYEFKLGTNEIFIVEVPDSDTMEARKVVNNYIERLGLN